MTVIFKGFDRTGIFLDNGIYTVITGYYSKEFKTLKGAERFATKQGMFDDE